MKCNLRHIFYALLTPCKSDKDSDRFSFECKFNSLDKYNRLFKKYALLDNPF